MKFEVAVCRELKPDVFSRLIMWWSGQPFSHAFVIVDEETIFEAIEAGVVKSLVSDLLAGGAHEIVHRVQVVPLDYPVQGCRTCVENRVLGYLQGSLGIEYSQSQLLGFLWKPLRKLFKNGRKKMVCSEFAARFLSEALGYDHPLLRDCDWMRPADVIEVAIGVGGRRIR